MLQSGPQKLSRRYSDASNVFGFPTSANQFQVLETEQSATSSRSTEQRQEGLIDPRTTRQQRWAARGTEAQRTEIERATAATVSVENAQGICTTSGIVINPGALQNSSQLFHSFSVGPSENFAVRSVGHPVHYMLETGVGVSGGDSSLYTDRICNKRISCAGMERSAGRPGNTPTRRIFACDENIEDSCAGQEWSAGRPGNRPFGARTAACLPTEAACKSGPYGSASQQTHNPGCNTREEPSIVTTPPRDRQPQQTTTSQQHASTSGRHAATNHASPAKVALHPRRPPYFCGGLDDDVHVWASIVDRWLDASQGEPSQQLTFVVSLLRGAAYDWYRHHETRTGCPGDWATLRGALLERFGTTIRVEKARAGIYRLRQGSMSVLEYADKFESCLAQIDDYNEAQYLVHFIFGLRPEIMRLVYVAQPATILVAKTMAERLELTHMATSEPNPRTKKSKLSKAQHRGTQKRRSGGRHQKKACKTVQWQKKNRTTEPAQRNGCIYAHSGAVETSCPDGYGPAAVWRSYAKDLPLRDRAGYMRRKGSIVEIDLVALTRREEKTSADVTVATMQASSVGPKAPRTYLHNRLLRRDRERKVRESVRERRYVTRLLETMVSPESGGTESCQGVTTDDLQGWRSIGPTEANISNSSAQEMPQTQLCAMSNKDQPINPRSKEDGVLMVVPARIFGREVRALIDSGASRCFISPATVTLCGLDVESHDTFMELADGKKVLSRGRTVGVLVVTGGYTVKMNLTVTKLLHGTDVVLGMTWL